MMNSNNRAPDTRLSLILRLRNTDDMVAWQEFCEVYQPLVRELAMRRGLQSADADDVTQEVLSRVAKHIENWDHNVESASFRAWLAAITKNQAIQFFREYQRRPSTGIDSRINLVPNELLESDFDLEHDRQMFAWAARRVQSRFETKTWQAFWLTAVEQKSVLETAADLKTSVAHVYVSRSRVMRALKQVVERSEFESKVDWKLS